MSYDRSTIKVKGWPARVNEHYREVKGITSKPTLCSTFWTAVLWGPLLRIRRYIMPLGWSTVRGAIWAIAVLVAAGASYGVYHFWHQMPVILMCIGIVLLMAILLIITIVALLLTAVLIIDTYRKHVLGAVIKDPFEFSNTMVVIMVIGAPATIVAGLLTGVGVTGHWATTSLTRRLTTTRSQLTVVVAAYVVVLVTGTVVATLAYGMGVITMILMGAFVMGAIISMPKASDKLPRPHMPQGLRNAREAVVDTAYMTRDYAVATKHRFCPWVELVIDDKK